jgi:hypothetical protein
MILPDQFAIRPQKNTDFKTSTETLKILFLNLMKQAAESWHGKFGLRITWDKAILSDRI